MKKIIVILILLAITHGVVFFVARWTYPVKVKEKIVFDGVAIALTNISDFSKVLKDYYKPVCETIPLGRDTIIVTDSSKLADIPWRAYMETRQVQTTINKKYPITIPIDVVALYRGVIDSIYIKLHEASTTIEVQTRQRWLGLRGSVGVGVNQDWLIAFDAEADIVFKQHWGLRLCPGIEQYRNPETNMVEWQGEVRANLRYHF